MHFFSGERDGYFTAVMLPLLECVAENDYTRLLTTTSGVFLAAEDIDRALPETPVITFEAGPTMK